MSYTDFVEDMTGNKPLPPTIETYKNTSAIRGKSAPGTRVQLSGKDGALLGTAETDEAGNWSVSLAAPTERYDVLRAVATDPNSNLSSDPAQVTVGGPRPKVMQAYASQKRAFGRTDAFRIDIYDTTGEQVATGYKVNQFKVWECQFYRDLTWDKQVMLIAADIDGNTSVPSFVDVAMLDVVERLITGIRGNGAPPNGLVYVMDTQTNQLITSIHTGSDGSWAAAFSEPFERGTEIYILAQPESGITSRMVPITLDSAFLFPLEVYGFLPAAGGGQTPVGLTKGSQSGSQANFTRIASIGTKTSVGTVQADGAAKGGIPLALQDGDLVRAYTTKDTQLSYDTYIKYNTSRPIMPYGLYATGTSITGKTYSTQSGLYAIALDENGHLLGIGPVNNGNFGFSASRSLQTGEIFSVCISESSDPTAAVPSSLFGVNAVDAVNDLFVELTVWGGLKIKGTCNYNGTMIDLSSNQGELFGDTATVTNGQWEVDLTTEIPDGTELIAYGTYYDGSVSPQKTGVPAPQTVNNYKPAAPIVTGPYQTDISGTEAFPGSNTYDGSLRIDIRDPNNNNANVVANVPVVLQGRPSTSTWDTGTIAQQPVGKLLNAIAKSDAGVESDPTPFTIEAANQVKPPPVGVLAVTSTATRGFGAVNCEVRYYKEGSSEPFLTFINSAQNWDRTVSGLNTGESVWVTQMDPGTNQESDPVYELVDIGEPMSPLNGFTATPTLVSGTVPADQPDHFSADAEFTIMIYTQSDGQKKGQTTAKAGQYFTLTPTSKLALSDTVQLYVVYPKDSNTNGDNYSYLATTTVIAHLNIID